jgi:hypothetical protein
MQDVDLLALVLPWARQEYAFELGHLHRPVYELTRSRHTLKAEDGSILSKVYECFSFVL